MWWEVDEAERAHVLAAWARLEERGDRRVAWLPGPYAMDTAELRAEVAFAPKGQRWLSVLAELNDRERAPMTTGELRAAIGRTEAAVPASPGDRPWPTPKPTRCARSSPAGRAAMADDIAAAMVATMDDDELAAHARELRERLGALPRGDERRGPLLTAFGRACAELNSRGLYGDGEPEPDGYAIMSDGAEADVIDGAAFWDEQ